MQCLECGKAITSYENEFVAVELCDNCSTKIYRNLDDLIFKIKRKEDEEAIKKYREVKKFSGEMDRIVSQRCPHIVDTSDPDTLSAQCIICGKWLGSYCKEAPDHVCHYWSIHDEEGFFVKLINGDKYYELPKDYEPATHDVNCCIICGESEEEK